MGAWLKASASKGFVKWENYPEYKPPRMINSPSDLSKLILGPLIHASDKLLFKSGFFVKGTDPKTWPCMLHALFGNAPVIQTDFTSFEAHHSGVYSELVYRLLQRTTRCLNLTSGIRRLIHNLVLGHNRCSFTKVKVVTKQRLMSGVLWTSSANGFLNLIINAFLYSKSISSTIFPTRSFRAKFEGDDGIFEDYDDDPELRTAMGLRLKFKKASHFSHVSFCSMHCSADGGCVVPDVRKILRKFFLLPKKYIESRPNRQSALIKAKALSYQYLFGRSPVLGPFLNRVLASVKHIDPRGGIAELSHYGTTNGTRLGSGEYLEVDNAQRSLFMYVNVIPIDAQMRIESAPLDYERWLPFLDAQDWQARRHLHGPSLLVLSRIPTPILDALYIGTNDDREKPPSNKELFLDLRFDFVRPWL